MPARCVTGHDGVVLCANVDPDDTQRPAPAGMLPALRRTASIPGPAAQFQHRRSNR